MKYFNLKLTIMVLLFSTLMLFTTAHARGGEYISSSVATYHIAQFSSSGTAAIDLFNSKGRMVGILIFYPDSYPYDLPAASRDSAGLVRMHYALGSFSGVVDQLRNESPIKLHYWTGSEPNSHLATGEREPIGEGE